MNIFSLINRINRQYLAGLAARLNPFGLTPANWALLDYLIKNGSATSIQVATYWGMEKPSVSANVKQLLKLELISADQGKDRREKQLVLTRKGETLVHEVAPIIREYQEKLLTSVPEMQKDVLHEGLSALLKAFKE